MYKCIYCEKVMTDQGICPKCKALKIVIELNTKTAFNILATMADEKGYQLLLDDNVTYHDSWI